MLYCLDCYGPEGSAGKSGTSCTAMMFLSNWLQGLGDIGKLPVSSRYLRGSDVYYYRDSQAGRRAADITANNLKLIYPLPDMVAAVPTTTLAELRRTRATAILVEVAYHDNVEDATWIVENIDAIGRNLALSVADILGVPFVEP